MATLFYPAIIERAGSGYSVIFPDVPGCVSAGDTLEEVAANAEEALAGHLEVSMEYGYHIASPSDLDTVEADVEIDEVARILVRVTIAE